MKKNNSIPTIANSESTKLDKHSTKDVNIKTAKDKGPTENVQQKCKKKLSLYKETSWISTIQSTRG